MQPEGLVLRTIKTLLFAALLLCAPGTALAAQVDAPGLAALRDDKAPWHLRADKMESLDDGIVLEASGAVELTRGEDYLKADFIRYFASTDWILLQGNVKVRLGADELEAREAEFDLNSNTGWLKDGNVFMAGPHIYFSGENVIKHWGDRYTFQNAKVTACDGPVPAWSLAAQEAVVEVDGYATLSRSSFKVLDTQVLFAPWMVLPAKTTRQSGLLLPDVGFSSLHGAYTTIPYYWVIDKSRDMTFYATWLERTGFMPGVEYRSRPAQNRMTWLAFDGLWDNKRIREDRFDPIDKTDGKIRLNHQRYWLRGMSDGEFGDTEWKYKFNVDYVSDQNFLREFRQRMTGFNNTRTSTFALFGRDLQELDRNRVSEGFAYRDWQRFRITAGLRYEQDPNYGHGNTSRSYDPTVQQLPALNAFLYKGRILPQVPLELEASAGTSYYYREYGTSGMKTEVYPRLSLPLDLQYATAIVSGGIRQTFYGTARQSRNSLLSSEPSPLRQTGNNRTIPDFSVQAFTQASRAWQWKEGDLKASLDNVGASQWTGLRHVFQPRLDYNRVFKEHQERNPFYTLDDRILASNTMEVGLNNLVTLRRNTVVADTPEDGTAPVSASLLPEYIDAFRLNISGGYDFEEAQRTRYRDINARRPLMDTSARMEVSPRQWVNLWSVLYYSMYDKGVTRSDQGLTLNHQRWGSMSFGYSQRSRDYDYRRQMQYDNLEDINFSQKLSLLTSTFNLNLSKQFSLLLSDYTNLNTGRTYERRVGLMYTDQCYRLVGRYIYTPRESSFQFSVQLLGLWE